jgi:PRTRC genetic system protein E
MTLFHQLFQLAQSAALTLTISADASDGRMTINVVPKPNADLKEPALATPLSLTATPDEFDADFMRVLSTYRASRQSLAEQADATNEVLAAAQQASAKRGATAASKATPVRHAAKPIRTAVGGAPAADDHDPGEVVADAPSPDGTTAMPSTAPVPVEPQLFG